jgi:hypothetical protein
LALCAAALLATAAPGGAAERSAPTPDSIAGGYYPADYEWPWVTAIIDNSRGQDSDFGNAGCTATLIAPRRVLTAAHCVVGSDGETVKYAGNYQVLVGVRSLERPEEGERRNVTSIAVHPELYLPNAGEHTNHAFYDIAVMFLDSPVSTPPAPMGTESDWAEFGTVMGWGHTNYDHDNPQYGPDLKAADLDLGSDNECHAWIDSAETQHYYSAIHVCATDYENDDCVTHGDSGGPLMVKTGGVWKLIGVTSFYPTTNPCGPIGFAWVGGPTLRSWGLTVAEPPPPTDPGPDDPAPDVGGPASFDLSMSRAEVRRYIRVMIKDNTNGKIRRLRSRCRRTSERSFRCRLRWRIKRRSYRGRSSFIHLVDGNQAVWTYTFRGTSRKSNCRRRCTRRLRW